MKNPYSQYQNTAMQTASRDRLLIMLFEGALKFGNQAMQGLNEKDHQKANNNLNRIRDIVNELMVTLDMKNGQELAQNLYRIYEYLNYLLIQANLKKDPERLKEVMEILTELKEAFQEAATEYRRKGGKLEQA